VKILDGEEATRPRTAAMPTEWSAGPGYSSGGGRIHPSRMNVRGFGPMAMFFRDGAEPRAGFGEAAFQVGLAGELVLEPVQIEHEEGVAAGGFEEGVIPLEHREAWAVRSPFRASKSWRSESFLWSCAHARAEKSNSIAATTRNLQFLMPVKISRGRGRR